jgi:hypothetical protein
MIDENDLFNELKLKNKNRFKKVYQKKEPRIIKSRQLGLYENSDDLIKVKVDEISKSLASKYKIEEEQIRETLYLKVRKMFLELL